MFFQDAHGSGEQHYLQQEQATYPFASNLSHQQ